MVERYFEVSCDVCGEPEWVDPGETLREFKRRPLDIRWRFKGRLCICYGCWKSGARWDEATCHQA
jgi:hypothetical protein